jgi:SAM-dependent methyltransferase
MSVEFDRHARDYDRQHRDNIRWTGEEPAYFAEYKARHAARLFDGRPPVPAILDFGTGIGNVVPHLVDAFPGHRIVGADVSERCLDIARSRCGPAAEFVHMSDGELPFATGTFGLVIAACVFHHIDHSLHPSVLGELHRVLAPGGRLAIYEHNPMNPLTVRAVDRCPLDDDAELVQPAALERGLAEAGFRQTNCEYTVFFPRQLAFLRGLERLLHGVPLGAQYCVHGSKPLSG